MDIPTGFPDKGQFDKKQISDQSFAFEWTRSAGSGGKDYGKDWNVEEGRVIVGWKIETASEHGTRGKRDLKLNMSHRGPLNLPTGVHNGIRLTPEKIPTGKGSTYKGTITVYTVTEEDWYKALKDE